MAERHSRIGRTMPVITAVRADAGNGRADDEHLTFRPVRNGLPEPAPWQRRADPASPAAGDERQRRRSALLAAKNAEITRLRRLAFSAWRIAAEAGSPEAREIAAILAGANFGEVADGADPH